jgi:hypothetical protein
MRKFDIFMLEHNKLVSQHKKNLTIVLMKVKEIPNLERSKLFLGVRNKENKNNS